MITSLLLLIAGLVLIVLGADYLVDGSSDIARKLGISEFVIGLTIVGMGTSAPEFVVSITGALMGNGDISIGNVVGSNIINTLLILGLTATIMPIAATRNNITQDLPMNIVTTILLFILGMNATIFGLGHNVLSRVDGIVFLILFALYMYYSFKSGHVEQEENSENNSRKLWLSITLVIVGLGGLILGGHIFVKSATSLARLIGVSDKFIAITVLAGGTSLPELATCIVAAAKKKGQLALGNIIGSNIFNILLILGCSALVSPLNFKSMNFTDFGFLILSSLLLLVCSATNKKKTIGKIGGVMLILCYIAYMILIFNKL